MTVAHGYDIIASMMVTEQKGTEKAIEGLRVKALKLEGSSLREQCDVSILSDAPSQNGRSKGHFGNDLEYAFFGILPNSLDLPDFWPIPLELKSAPLKLSNATGQLVPKERIVLGIINYFDIVKESFEKSHFLLKNKTILIVWYVYDKLLHSLDMKVDITDIWRCIQEDGKQIEEDWNLIVNKIKSGHAEDISEGDTLYLGACTKGSTAALSYRNQPFSKIKAKQRAFCFKISYVKHIYETMKERKRHREEQQRFLPKDGSASLEQTVLNLFSPFIGKTSSQIEHMLGIHSNAKSRFALYARTILGYSEKNKSFYEFDAANIQIKTIRIERNGKPKEDMSFKNIKFKEVIEQDWEDSDLYQELISKFIFVVFRKTSDGLDYYLDKVKFWNMPESDLDKVQQVWEKTKTQIIRRDFDHLPKKSENPIIHVRTKGKDSSDLTETADGSWVTKRCFFLNNTYIASKIL